MKKTFTINYRTKVRAVVPDDWKEGVRLSDSMQLETGIYAINAKRGKKYGYAHLYSTWVPMGAESCEGDEYVAYLLSNPWHAEQFEKVEAAVGK